MPVYSIGDMPPLDLTKNNPVFQRKNWEKVSAVKNNQVYNIFSDYISRTGPRIIYGIELIAHFTTGYECDFDYE
jgi:iron complex transport system substrate-binding protein